MLWWFLLFAAIAAGQTQNPSAAMTVSGYVGSNVCKTCHSSVWLNFFKNPHYKSLASGNEPPERTGCEGCHGPGKAHVEVGAGKATTIRAFSLMQPRQVLDACLGCHAKDFSRANIRRSQHSLADVV